ncbi:MAG: hypothetical protein JW717_12445 [Marinilabiliaceae bacterium]|nr:hypothetical protein [Marinilabiliaceae bacterium]
MKRYVEQLLEDIEHVQNKSIEAIENWKLNNKANTIDEYFEPRLDDGVILCDLFGLQQFFLPAESYLDDEEVNVLSTAIIQLWRSYNLYPIFTKKLPRRIKYSLLRDYWNQMVYPNPDGRTDIELCDYNTCPFCFNCPACTYQKTNLKPRATA